MKKILLIIPMFLFVLNGAKAQISVMAMDGLTFINLSGIDLYYMDETEHYFRTHRYTGHLGLLDFGFNNLAAPDYSAYQQKDFLDINMGRSIYIGLNLLNFSTPINKAKSLGITTGLGIVWRNYVFADDITIQNNGGRIMPVTLDPPASKSKYNTFSFQVPVLLEYTIKNFFVSAGLYGEILVSSQTKTKPPKVKHKGDLYSNPLSAGATARIGYYKFYVFGNYSFVNLMDAGHAPATKTWTVGLGLSF